MVILMPAPNQPTSRLGIIVPFFNHGQFAQRLLSQLSAYSLTLIVVDDGSEAKHRAALLAACEAFAERLDITLIHHDSNQGKGAAVISGFATAKAAGWTHALQIDADCQHDFAVLPDFVAAAEQHPTAVICGYPRYDASVPKSRLYPRYITHFWVNVNTLSGAIKDAMCGFRCYPLPAVSALLASYPQLGRRMDFDIDVIVRLYWAGAPVVNLPVGVTYHADASSHFRLWADNVLISRTHARLFFGMLWRAPRLCCRTWRRRST